MSPIRSSEKARYPKDWKQIILRIRARAKDQCECRGECGRVHNWHGADRCAEFNRLPAAEFRGMVVLTVAHLDHTPEHCADDNLKAMCQRCHLRYDRDHHRRTRFATRDGQDPTPRFL